MAGDSLKIVCQVAKTRPESKEITYDIRSEIAAFAEDTAFIRLWDTDRDLVFMCPPWEVMDDDTDLVAEVAAELVSQMGEGAVAYAIDQADIAMGIGDAASAQVWFDIATVAADLIAERP
jgi:hypothetical protein